jgi:acetyl esterase/lipase
MTTPLLSRCSRILAPLAAVLGLCAAVPAHAATKPALQESLDIRYAPGGGDRHTLDVIAPKGAKNRPVVLFVHGGAWMIGDKDLFGVYRNTGRDLARMDVVAVMINYQLSPTVKHPEHVKDVARAYAWVRGHIADYGGDPDDIIVAGHSAGGHLAALLATDDEYLRDPALGLKDADLAALRGVIAVSGVYRIPGPSDCAQVVAGLLDSLPRFGDERVNRALAWAPVLVRFTPGVNPFRLAFGDDPKTWKQASPLWHVHKGLPPFLVLYAEDEMPLLADMASEFVKELKESDVPVELKRIDHVNHNTILWRMNRSDDPVAKAVRGFLDEYARPAAKS